MNKIFPVIVCIAKSEQDYIVEWVTYHLALGFQKIFIYDNEDTPTYAKLFTDPRVEVGFLPGKWYWNAPQYEALARFKRDILESRGGITHCAHIDIDEFIVFKQHKTVQEFITQYFTGDTKAIVMNWKFFGSNFHAYQTSEPVLKRFYRCGTGHPLYKTLFQVDSLLKFANCHRIILRNGYARTTDNIIADQDENYTMVFDSVQLNHYKVKTWPEFCRARLRGRADFFQLFSKPEDVHHSYEIWNQNDTIDKSAIELASYHKLWTPTVGE